MENSKGKRVAYEGNYGDSHYKIHPPLPSNPPICKNKWGYEFYYVGPLDDWTGEFVRISNPNGYNVGSIEYIQYEMFPTLMR